MALHDFERDALFVSQTGSGKTLMFLLPLLEQLVGAHAKLDTTFTLPKATTFEPHALIIVPTPDLAVQVKSVAMQLTVAMQSSLAVESLDCPSPKGETAGGSIASIVVATTDQLHDRLHCRDLSTRRLRVVAIDEVDAVLCTPRAEDASLVMIERAVSSTTVVGLH